MSPPSNSDSLSTKEKELGDVVEHSLPVQQELIVDTAEEKRIVRKVDIRLLPIIGALYSFALIDRINLPNARLNGAEADLMLNVGTHYSIANLVFFIPYIILELPSNIIVRRVGASRWLGSIGVLWGAVMLGMGFVTDWQQLAGLRALLGALEAGFFPACVYLISTWYVRREVQFRMACFYLISVLIGAFANIFAYGLAQIKVGTMAGWRWIFIIEGLITIVLAFSSYALIIDFPDKAKFLTERESTLLRERIDRDRGDFTYDPLTWAKVTSYAVDIKPWAYGILFMCATMPAYAYAYFFPILLKGMGFSTKDSQLLTAPPAIASCLFALTTAKLADRTGKRGYFIIFQALFSLIGLLMTTYHTNVGVRYAGGFLGLCGAQANIPGVLSYSSNNIRGQSKRSYVSALVVGFGGIGGILASTTYMQSEFPHYTTGLWVTMGLQITTVVVVSALSCWFTYRNKLADRGLGGPIEGLEGFRYTL